MYYSFTFANPGLSREFTGLLPQFQVEVDGRGEAAHEICFCSSCKSNEAIANRLAFSGPSRLADAGTSGSAPEQLAAI
jgi:hypothetical protein